MFYLYAKKRSANHKHVVGSFPDDAEFYFGTFEGNACIKILIVSLRFIYLYCDKAISGDEKFGQV